MAPLATLAAVVLWLAIVLSTRYVSLGSIAAALLAAVGHMDSRRGSSGRRDPTALTLTAALVAVAVVLRHRANIRRLLNGDGEPLQKRAPGQGGER